jgi:intracellular sulfur oxidation DsrE/DsrF family protein
MSHGTDYSDEQLQAFVDDEINMTDRAEIMEAVRLDDELACRICELLQMKDTVRLAYREPEQPVSGYMSRHPATRWQVPTRAAAALLIFAIGTTTGVVLKSYNNGPVTSTTNTIAAATDADHEIKRVIIHISSGEPQKLDQALMDAEELLVSYKDRPELVQLEVVANTAGLALLRADTSPYPERIRRMAQQFDNISFLACSRTIEKLRLRGIDVHLVPEAKTIPGALEKTVDCMKQGWVYIRV